MIIYGYLLFVKNYWCNCNVKSQSIVFKFFIDFLLLALNYESQKSGKFSLATLAASIVLDIWRVEDFNYD